MNQISIEVNNDWLTIKEASESLGISASALHHWLNTHSSIKEGYTKQGRVRNHQRGLLLSPQGLLVVANMRDSNRGNQHGKGCEPGS